MTGPAAPGEPGALSPATVDEFPDLSEAIGLIGLVESEGLGLPPANQAELLRRVSSVRAEEAVAMASELSARLVKVGRGARPGAQAAAADMLLPDDLAGKAKALLPGPPTKMLVHQEQLLIATKLAVFYGQAGRPRIPVDLLPIGQVLLAINDLYDPRLDSQSEDDHLVGIVARRSVAIGNESTRNLIARYYDLLVRRVRLKQDEPAALDLDRAMIARCGLDVMTMMAFALYYSLPTLHPQPEVLFGPGGFWSAIGELNRAIPDPALRQRLMRCLSADRRWYVERFHALGEADSTMTTSFLPFQERPIYLMDDGRPIMLSPLFMVDRMSVGMYWALHAQFGADDPVEGVRRFTAFSEDSSRTT